MATRGDILAGETPPKDNVIASDEQKVTICEVILTYHKGSLSRPINFTNFVTFKKFIPPNFNLF